MKAAFAVSEAVPYAKTGGLADVAGALPYHLRKIGVETAVLMPRYKGVEAPVIDTISVVAGERYKVEIRQLDRFFFIDVPNLFDRDGLYGDSNGDYPDNCERFTVFCRAVSEFIRHRDFDIVHCHDWQSGLIPLYVNENRIHVRSVFTIHNIGYQGLFPHSRYPVLGIKPAYFNVEGLEYYGAISFLKAGIVFSDAITTVSENYAQEIQTAEYGFGMEGILKEHRMKLAGIINGVDYLVWDPGQDPEIYHQYRDVSGKSGNKKALSEELGLDSVRPLVGMVSRITGQKGFDLLLTIFEDMIELGFNIVILGTGDMKIESKLQDYARIYPDKISVNLKFDNRLAHCIYAASDFFLMPSRYEPCGLGQLIAFRYGTLPIVRATGGLADTVIDLGSGREPGSGIVFAGYDRRELLKALERAMHLYHRADDLERIAGHVMKLDFSWDKSARSYRQLYEKTLKSVP